MRKVKIKIKRKRKRIKILNKKEKNQFTESSGFFPLISNLDADTFDRDFLSASVPS
jgi:hypothetical protein